jgi:micrococcal nuclease
VKIFKIALVFFFLLFSCKGQQVQSKLPNNFQAKVIGVKDGDTIEVLFENEPITIRFAHVDCPEIKKHQPFGQAAKKFTSDICFGQIVTVENNGEFDRYKRLIAVIINDRNENVNKELVKAGFAWHFRKYSTDKSYHDLEFVARQNRTGLWADDNPIPPWDWRKP